MRFKTDNKGPLAGISLVCAGYACFAIQDCIAKWLVSDYAVPQILFIRSVVIVFLTGAIARLRRHPRIFRARPHGTAFVRAGLMLLAWLLFFQAAGELDLAVLMTLSFSAPIMVMLLSGPILKEEVKGGRWTICLAGFVGVLVAANPTRMPNILPAAMCVLAGFFWALSTILLRRAGKSETTTEQILIQNLLFVPGCALSLLWLWKTPDVVGWTLMLGLGVVATVGQFLLYEGFRYAPASTLAPMEYTGLLWAFLFGYLIWSEVPAANVIIGALLITLSTLALVSWERKSASAR